MRTKFEEIHNKVRKWTQISNHHKDFRTNQVRKSQVLDEAPDKRKNKEPKRFGDPIKHSIKEISENLTGGGLLKEALKEYRNQLRDFKDRNDKPMESKVR